MLLITEVLVLFRVGWNLGDEEKKMTSHPSLGDGSDVPGGDYGDLGDIVFSRKFIKSVWVTMRIMSYSLFIVRTGVVFRNWRAKAKNGSNNLYKGIRELFRNEKQCLLVSLFYSQKQF